MRLVLATRITQQALQLDHGLARQDDFLLGHFHIQRGAGKGQAVAVGGDQAQGLALGHKQNAVEVVANVLHCHGKRHLAQQVLQRLLWHGKHGAEGGRFLHQWEVFSRQALQGEAALAALQDQLGLARLQTHGLVAGHGLQDVDELACAHGGGEVARVATQLGGGADLDFEVAGGQLQRIAGFADQHVGQDGQRVPTLHDARHGLEYRENLVLCCLQDDHVINLLWFLGRCLDSSGAGRASPCCTARHFALEQGQQSVCSGRGLHGGVSL